MITTYHPPLNAGSWQRTLQGEVIRHRALSPGTFIEVETLLSRAEESLQIRTELPRAINRFPFNRFNILKRLALKIYEVLFREQRTVNAVLISAIRETVALLRSVQQEAQLNPAWRHHTGAEG